MTKVIGYLILLLALRAHSEVSRPADSSGTRTGSTGSTHELLNCQPASSNEEASARSAAESAHLSGEEVLARLLFSESLSTGYWAKRCDIGQSNGSDLMTAIGWGIMARVHAQLVRSPRDERASNKAYYAAIFAKGQFRTSFSVKRPNPFAIAFLCPSRANDYLRKAGSKMNAETLFSDARKAASKIVSQYQASNRPPAFQATNFFYPHSEYMGEKRPGWAKTPPNESTRSYINLFGFNRPCAEFYRLK